MTSAVRAAPSEAKKQTTWGETLEVGKTVFYALAIALVLRVLLFQPFTIPSASMEPNLLQGDYIIVSKASYGYSRHSIPFSPPIFSGRVFDRAPTRGDIIVFKLPRDGHTDYIKRLVGMPGDHIQLREGVVWLNGKPLPRKSLGSEMEQTAYGPHMAERFQETMPSGRTYVTYDYGTTPADNTEEFVVPAGHYFMLGDNRDNSLDSRFPMEEGVGFVPAENLVGKAQIILLSWYPAASLIKPWTWFTEARPSRFFNILH